MSIGGSVQLHLSPSNATSIVWNSTDPRIAQVSQTGLVTGLASGVAGILANYQGHTTSTLVTISTGNLSWSSPITITQGGTYSGNWKSTDPNTAAVTVATTEPVLIENSHITGPSDLIDDPYWGNNLTVKNVIAIGTNPNVSGQPFGMFVDAQNPIQLDVENCYFENVHYGIWVRGYAGNRDGTQTITLLNNRGRNMLGLESNGKNGFLPGDQNWSWSHAIQLSDVSQVPGIRIAWNEIINYPYQSLVNEVINLYDSGGTASSPAQIHDNFLQGAFPYDPATDTYNGGGFTTDGSEADSIATASAYNNVYNNQIVGTVNMGIEFGAGHDNTAYNNTVISSGLLPNHVQIPSQNVGLTVYDTYGNRSRGTMYNNDMHDNTVGWMCWAARCAWDGYRNDDYFPDDPTFYETNPSAASNPIPLSAETREYTIWQNKLTATGIAIGSITSPGNPSVSHAITTISPSGWYTIANTRSALCIETAAWGYSNGTTIQQNTCGTNQLNQEWRFQPIGGGYYAVVNRYALERTEQNRGWTAKEAPSASGQTIIDLGSYTGSATQQWMPVSLGNGEFKFVDRNQAECLDIPNASSLILVPLQQYACNGTAAQSYVLEQK